jgi:hypothetical protein
MPRFHPPKQRLWLAGFAAVAGLAMGAGFVVLGNLLLGLTPASLSDDQLAGGLIAATVAFGAVAGGAAGWLLALRLTAPSPRLCQYCGQDLATVNERSFCPRCERPIPERQRALLNGSGAS